MKLYLAGPDVFLPDASAVGKIKLELCHRYGFSGLFPLDSELNVPVSGALSKAIFESNIAMLDEADAILANLTPYRGVSADVGTVFEVGYGYARGKPVFGYSNVQTPFVERVRRFTGGAIVRGDDARLYAADAFAVEDFESFDNLMIAEALRATGMDVVVPEAATTDVWRDTSVFERALGMIRAKMAAHFRFAIAR